MNAIAWREIGCDRCEGTGSLIRVVKHAGPSGCKDYYTEEYAGDCPDCDGTGKVDDRAEAVTP